MAEKEVTVRVEADFHDDDYGWLSAHEDKVVRADVAARWIAEGLALPVLMPEAIETADLKHKK